MNAKYPISPLSVRPGMRLNLGVLNAYHPTRRAYVLWNKPFFVVRVEIEKGLAGGLSTEDGFMVSAYNAEGYRVTWYETSSNPHVITGPSPAPVYTYKRTVIE